MKQKKPALRCAVFVALLLCFFVLGDLLCQAVFAPFFLRSGRFKLNDFEITQRDHPEQVWERVFFGSSTVIAGYREEESAAGYVNLGLDDGTVVDLWQMIRGGHIRIGSELVIGVNEMTLYDKFPTNPNYIWHKPWYEPYVLFCGTRLQTLAEQTTDELLLGTARSFPYLGQQKSYYWGTMSQKAIDEKLQSARYAVYLTMDYHDFDQNFAALESILDWAGQHGVRVRIVFMPCNPAGGTPQSRVCALDRLTAFCAQHGVELLDLHDAFDQECFYDIGHLNREYGSHRFTKEIDPWLNQ